MPDKQVEQESIGVTKALNDELTDTQKKLASERVMTKFYAAFCAILMLAAALGWYKANTLELDLKAQVQEKCLEDEYRGLLERCSQARDRLLHHFGVCADELVHCRDKILPLTAALAKKQNAAHGGRCRETRSRAQAAAAEGWAEQAVPSAARAPRAGGARREPHSHRRGPPKVARRLRWW